MIAVIAGTGTLPTEACKNLLARQEPFFIITLFPESNASELKELTGGRIEIIDQEFYKPGQILALVKEKKTTQLLFIGKVDKTNLLRHLKLDWLAIKLLGSLISKSDKDVMEALLAELASHNIQVIRQDSVLGGLLVPPGVLTGAYTPELEQEIALGMRAASAIAQADIGQTIVIKDGMILAVEAIEGTDACIKRGLELGTDGIIICKSAHTKQNRKFDLPTLGPASLEPFKPGQIRAIAWQSSHTLIAQKELFIKKAADLGIILISVDQK